MTFLLLFQTIHFFFFLYLLWPLDFLLNEGQRKKKSCYFEENK